jgi:hypothetical protein
MYSKKVIVSTVLLLVLGLTGLQAQEVIATAGNNASGSEGSISYSVGQVVCQTNNSTYGSEIQGVQQPYEISIISGIEAANKISLSISAYPNPTSNFLTLSIDNFELSDLTYQLFDIKGRLIQTNKIEADKTSISTINLVSATYFLIITQNNNEVKTFNIIKN